MSFIKAVIPYISILITKCENWDFASTRIKNEIWKLFMSYILNVAIIVFISVEFVLRKAYFRSQPIMSELTDFECKEDQVGISFFQLTITDFVLGIIITELMNLIQCAFFSKKAEFSSSGETVSLIYFQALSWATILFYPYITILMPIMFYIRFKYSSYVLRYHRSVPNENYDLSVIFELL